MSASSAVLVLATDWHGRVSNPQSQQTSHVSRNLSRSLHQWRSRVNHVELAMLVEVEPVTDLLGHAQSGTCIGRNYSLHFVELFAGVVVMLVAEITFSAG